MPPKLSVLTPSLNYGRFLADAIASVAAEDAIEIEHVVQDGGSSDETKQILKAAPENVVWTSERDAGQSDALNRALERASGDWIAWLNADEFYLPGGLMTLLTAAGSSGADVVYGDTIFVDIAGSLTRLASHHPFRAWYLRWYGCYFATCSTLFRRDVLGEHPFDTDFGLTMDWDLFLRLHRGGARFAYTRYPVGAFRLHEMQVVAREQEHLRDFERLETTYGVGPRRQRQLGRWVHDADKLLHGAYGPQLRARMHIGRDMRWFNPSPAGENFRSFLADCYGDGPKTFS